MKKIIIAAVIVMAGAFGIFKANSNNLSALQIENIELLAQGESGCPNGCVAGDGGCYCNGSYPQYAEAGKH